MKIVCFVPLKLNNKRVLGKNIKAFDNGKSLYPKLMNPLHLITLASNFLLTSI